MFYTIFWYKNMKLWNIIKSQPKRAVCGYQKVNRITKKNMNMTLHLTNSYWKICAALVTVRYLTMHWINPVCESYEIDFRTKTTSQIEI